jgi:hypothetical protein
MEDIFIHILLGKIEFPKFGGSQFGKLKRIKGE